MKTLKLFADPKQYCLKYKSYKDRHFEWETIWLFSARTWDQRPACPWNSWSPHKQLKQWGSGIPHIVDVCDGINSCRLNTELETQVLAGMQEELFHIFEVYLFVLFKPTHILSQNGRGLCQWSSLHPVWGCSPWVASFHFPPPLIGHHPLFWLH